MPSTSRQLCGVPKFVISPAIPAVGATSTADVRAISLKSCGALQELGSGTRWVHSDATGDKTCCVYDAADDELVREPVRRGGFPADRVAGVMNMVDPATAGAGTHCDP